MNDKIITPSNYWQMLQQSAFRLLMLDYDGTLAPFQVERMAAYPLDGVVELLKEINQQQTKVAIVSGRPIAELITLLGPIAVELIGGHGFERRSAAGEYWQQPLTAKQQEVLQTAHDLALEVVDYKKIERKHASVAIHTRGLDKEEQQTIEKEINNSWSKQLNGEVTVRHFKGGLELRAKGRSKGTAVRELVDNVPQNSFLTYLGDDETDEDAFAILKEVHGYAFKVGDFKEKTVAQGKILDCQTVKQFLQLWLEKMQVVD